MKVRVQGCKQMFHLGDEMNLTLLMQESIIRACKALSVENTIMDLNAPFKVSGNLALPAPLLNSMTVWRAYTSNAA